MFFLKFAFFMLGLNCLLQAGAPFSDRHSHLGEHKDGYGLVLKLSSLVDMVSQTADVALIGQLLGVAVAKSMGVADRDQVCLPTAVPQEQVDRIARLLDAISSSLKNNRFPVFLVVDEPTNLSHLHLMRLVMLQIISPPLRLCSEAVALAITDSTSKYVFLLRSNKDIVDNFLCSEFNVPVSVFCGSQAFPMDRGRGLSARSIFERIDEVVVFVQDVVQKNKLSAYSGNLEKIRTNISEFPRRCLRFLLNDSSLAYQSIVIDLDAILRFDFSSISSPRLSPALKRCHTTGDMHKIGL